MFDGADTLALQVNNVVSYPVPAYTEERVKLGYPSFFSLIPIMGQLKEFYNISYRSDIYQLSNKSTLN